MSLVCANFRPSCRLVDDLAGDGGVAGAANLLRLQVRLLGVGKLRPRDGPFARNSVSSSITAFSTRSMFSGLVMALTMKVAAGSRGEAVNDDVTP